MSNDLALREETGLEEGGSEVGAAAAVSREQHEIQAAIITAKKFPRDENKAFAKVKKSFQRENLAVSANYSFPRGGKAITGPSVDLARECARCWGNMRYGLRIVSQDKDWIHIKGYAIDLESNSYIEAEDEFRNLIQRSVRSPNGDKQTIWVEPDERDKRELVGRKGAILVRNCILQLLPPDLVDDAAAMAKDTLARAAKGQLKDNREDAIRKIAFAFEGLGIETTILERKLGHPLAAITDSELVDLRGIWKSIADGNSAPQEHFDFGKSGIAVAPSVATNELTERLAEGTKNLKTKKNDKMAESPTNGTTEEQVRE